MSVPEPQPSVVGEMLQDLHDRISPYIEHIKFIRGHQGCEGWSLDVHEERYKCGCGTWLDSKEEAEG